MFGAQLINNFAFLIISFAAMHVKCIQNRDENVIQSDPETTSSKFYSSLPQKNFASNREQLQFPPASSLNVLDFTAADAVNGIDNEIQKAGSEHIDNRFPLTRSHHHQRYKANSYSSYRPTQSSHQYVNNNNGDQHHWNKRRLLPLSSTRKTTTTTKEHSLDASASDVHYRTYQYPPFDNSNAIVGSNRDFPYIDGPPQIFENSPDYLFPQRPSLSPPLPPPPSFVAAADNYANTYGNYLSNDYRQPNYNRRATPPPRPPSYDYFDSYQIGELPPAPIRPPPQHHAAPMPPPPPQPKPSSSKRPPSYHPPISTFSSNQNSGVLSAIASLFTSTFGQTPAQAIGSQLGNFIPFLGGGGGGGGGGSGLASNALSSLLNNIVGNRQPTGEVTDLNRRPFSMQIVESLEKVAQNDELQCVPKVLCQMIGSPTRRQQLPGIVTSPTITNFVAALPSSSPALIFGRAMLLGLTGGENSCFQTYQKCSKSDEEVLFYLNNYRGGFFKLFSGPKEKKDDDKEQMEESSDVFILPGDSVSSQTNQRPKPNFGAQLTSNLGAVFRYVLSGFLQSQVVQAKKRKRRSTRNNFDTKKMEDYYDEVDDSDEMVESSSSSSSQLSDVEGRILHKENFNELKIPFFPPDTVTTSKYVYEKFPPYTNDLDVQNESDNRIGKRLKFPVVTSTSFSDSRDEIHLGNKRLLDFRKGRKTNFIGDSFLKNSFTFADQTKRRHPPPPPPRHRGTKMIFPDRTGTGKLLFDANGKLVDKEEHQPSNLLRSRKRNPINYQSSSSANPRYQMVRPPLKHEDDPNIYVTNSQGIVDYYIDPRGRKNYL